MNSFFNELRRRNVLRLAATYALVAWILIEAGSVLLPTFGVDEGFFRAYVLVILAGFVASLVIAWVFEVTPEGVKFDHQVDRSVTASPSRSKSNAIIIALLAVALGVSITFNVTGIRDQETLTDAALADLSIAVLPFTSRSTDPDNQFFADGIHDDLLTRLADIDSLRVISRTSVSEYRDTTKNLREIGSELGVATVVEGAVQKSGDQVRITVQLIDAATDEHIWADSYDRALTMQNVFDIQSTVSSEIATALRAALTPEEEIRLAARPTHSIQALAFYTEARDNLQKRRFDTLIAAREQFERAIEIDPEYAQAYAGLAETLLVTHSNHKAIDTAEAFELAGNAIERAIEIDDQLAEAYAVKGLLEYSRWSAARVGNGNLVAAQSFQRAIDLNPNLASTYVWFSSLRETAGDIDGAVDLLTKAMQVDPLGRIAYVNLPGLYAMQGHSDKATHLLIKAMEIFPDWPTPYAFMSNHLRSLGRLDEAVAWSLLAQSMSDDPMTGGGSLGVFVEFGDIDKLREFGEQFPENHPLYAMGAAFMYFMDNNYSASLQMLQSVEVVSEIEANFAYPLASMSALKLGDLQGARDYIVRANPILASDTVNSVDKINVKSAILLAYVLKQLGENRHADNLLTQAHSVVQKLPRVGLKGHGISDVHILAIQGQRDAAIEALRDAIDEGFVSLMSYDFWTLDQDPIVDNLRDDSRFKAMQQELNQRIETMRENVERAEEAGDWSELLGKVRGELLTAALQVN
jgi:TolB-like protein/tetratricopeptide (TPR) repeat protein